MARGKAEDAGGLTPAKDDNAALHHFGRRTLPMFRCVDYKAEAAARQGGRFLLFLILCFRDGIQQLAQLLVGVILAALLDQSAQP